jgi:dTMP kinase
MLGTLIVIEGADGAGKATQTKLLVNRLRNEGVHVETLDFPQYESNFFGAHIKQCLRGEHGDFLLVPPTIASLLYAADRFESKPQIEMWLNDGAVIVLDRYVSANMMHQGAKINNKEDRTTFLKWLDTMEHEIFGMPRPTKTLYLDVPVEMRQTLIRFDSTRQEDDVVEADLPHQLAAEACARQLVHLFGWHPIVCIEGEKLRTPAEIHEEIFTYVKNSVLPPKHT